MVLTQIEVDRQDLFATIKLTNGLCCIIDWNDYDWVTKNRWKAKQSSGVWYAVRSVRQAGEEKLIRLHRYIVHCPHLCQVHHKNRNGLDNRKSNLEIVTRNRHKEIHNIR